MLISPYVDSQLEHCLLLERLPMLQNNNFCVIWSAGKECFYFIEKLFSVQDIQVLTFLTIP